MERKDALASLVDGMSDVKIRTVVPIPDVTPEEIAECRVLCKGNQCGNYGKNHGCPPSSGSENECLALVKTYADADVLIKTFYDVDMKDAEFLNRMMSEFQRSCRDIMIGLRKEGFDVMALADGPCNYCERCTRLDDKECRSPEMRVPSVSGFGIKMDKYINGIGEDFSFNNDKITFYGLFLFR